VGKTKVGKGMKLMLEVRSDGRPVAALVAPANRAENHLVEDLLASGGALPLPQVLLADKAYDDDRLRAALDERGVRLLAPHRSNRTQSRTNDGRHLRRYRRRWIIERTFSWLQNFRRLLQRHERYAFIFAGFVSMAALITTVRGL
jgi:transposase